MVAANREKHVRHVLPTADNAQKPKEKHAHSVRNASQIGVEVWDLKTWEYAVRMEKTVALSIRIVLWDTNAAIMIVIIPRLLRIAGMERVIQEKLVQAVPPIAVHA